MVRSFVSATEKKFKLITRRTVVEEKEGLEVTCLAEGLYPQPTLDISVEYVSAMTLPFTTFLLDVKLENCTTKLPCSFPFFFNFNFNI